MKKIVVIEDEHRLRENIMEILELEGYEVFSAENGLIGLNQIEVNKPDLVLCDIKMNQYDGYWLISELRKKDHLIHIPFIFISAKVDRTDIRNGMALGADDYLTKPFTRAELITAIKMRLNRKEDFQKNNGDNSEFISPEELSKVKEQIKNLTVSEKRILKHISDNKSSLDIAKQLFISIKTVDNHRSNISTKLALKGHLSLLKFCLNYKPIINDIGNL
jgi:DNA-binding NarL/FixJ family response regulator